MKKKEPVKKTTKKVVDTKKETTKKPYKKRALSAGAEFYKKKSVKKKKENYICSKCLEEVDQNTLNWVLVEDFLGMTFEILICDECIEHKAEYIERYKKFEVIKPLYKKRVYKKKNAQ
jgi:hypothetical protein